jgi:hypothetical protein
MSKEYYTSKIPVGVKHFFMDRMFEKLHLTLEEYERIRILSQTNRVEANRDLSMIIFRRQSVDLAIFKQCLIETEKSEHLLFHVVSPVLQRDFQASFLSL